MAPPLSMTKGLPPAGERSFRNTRRKWSRTLFDGTIVRARGLLVYSKCVIVELFEDAEEPKPLQPLSVAVIAKLTGISIIGRKKYRLTS